jgi:hypothetical protein
MKRTQLYLDDDLWNALHARASREGTTISDLMRQAARERYLGKIEARRTAMQAFIGAGRSRPASQSSASYFRKLRRGKRVERLAKA